MLGPCRIGAAFSDLGPINIPNERSFFRQPFPGQGKTVACALAKGAAGVIMSEYEKFY
jgi:hypothetical protein